MRCSAEWERKRRKCSACGNAAAAALRTIVDTRALVINVALPTLSATYNPSVQMRRLLIVTILLAQTALAEGQRVRGRLPLEAFSAMHGLPSDSVVDILRDSRGSMWFATLDGLSRFDGHEFVNYSTDDGLPDRMIRAVAEDRQGSIWVATLKGVVSMSPNAKRRRPLFKSAGQEASTTLLVDREGAVWSGCGNDLCMVRDGRLEVVESFRRAGGKAVGTIRQSPSGELWVGTEYGLLRRGHDGAWKHFAVQPFRGGDNVTGLMFDTQRRLWIANPLGIFVLGLTENDADPRPLFDRASETFLPGMTLRLPRAGEVVRITLPGAPRIVHARTPYRWRDGTVWLPMAVGMLRITPERIDLLDESDGLPSTEMNVVKEDVEGNLWIGTRGGGAFRLAQVGAMSYTRTHGLASERITSVFPLEDGSMCATNRNGMSCIRDGTIRNGALFPRGMNFRGWGWNQIVVRDRRGAWWFPTDDGLIEWPAVKNIEELGRIAPTKIHAKAEGLSDPSVFRVWQDSRGTLWVSTFGEQPLSRRDPGSSRFVSFGEADGFIRAAPTAFAEDRAGAVWIGVYTGALLRTRPDGTFERITRGVPGGQVRDLKIDSKGRLWIAALDGLSRIENPTAPQSQFVLTSFSRRNGLASDSAYCIAELPDGRMAIGSQRGLDLLDLGSGIVTHVSASDGLAANEVGDLALDDKGGLWMATIGGLSYLRTLPRLRNLPPPQPRIAAIRLEGLPIAVAELGTTFVSGVRIEYPRRGMTVRYSAAHFDPKQDLRFEYRLATNEPWTNAGSQRAVVFDRLPAGEATFEVRSVAANGTPSAPARISFLVIPPFWSRMWFIALSVAMLAAIAIALHRSRVMRLLALQRMRLRVATDLHDDLGSNLSRISILSELAKGNANQSGQRLLDEIAESARDLVDSLGDSIWSIDPRRDDLQSLLLRLRHFTAAVFEAQSISADFRLPGNVGALRLDPEQRREIYLILKEALNNVARHASALNVRVSVTNVKDVLHITVEDDGRGFVTGTSTEREDGGRGIPSMTDRAKRVGGSLGIASEPGRGTTVTVALPV